MSRRIAFLLAASAALIATQARADRECFENCHLPDAIEQPVAAAPSPVTEVPPADTVAVNPAADAAQAKAAKADVPAKLDAAIKPDVAAKVDTKAETKSDIAVKPPS